MDQGRGSWHIHINYCRERMTTIRNTNSLLHNFEVYFGEFERSLNGESQTGWHKIRKKAFQKLVETGFPDRKHEEYRYTPMTQRIEKAFQVFPDFDLQKSGDKQPDISACLPQGMKANILVFVNGTYQAHLSKCIPEDNLHIAELADAMGDQEVEKDLGESVSHTDSFALLNTAFSSNGIVLKVLRNQIIQNPVYMIHITDGSLNNRVNQPRILILFDKNSQATIAEFFFSKGDKTIFTNAFTEIRVGENATVRYIRAGLENNQALRVSNISVYQEESSTFTSVNVDLEGKLIRNNLNIIQNGRGCETHLYGFYLLTDNMHVDNHTVVDHKYPDSQSNEIYKGIMANKSTGVFNGKIYVRQDAQRTNAYQQNSNILLSNEATINTKPQLEIWADDVKCSHGCTTGQIDQEQIFYMRSRGLDEVQAKTILLHAFALDILNHINIEELRSMLDLKVIEKLNNV